jgi:hypothetical protein
MRRRRRRKRKAESEPGKFADPLMAARIPRSGRQDGLLYILRGGDHNNSKTKPTDNSVSYYVDHVSKVLPPCTHKQWNGMTPAAVLA